eukprot:10170567-Heterocapsa_arctica.AAC.1
MKDERHLLSQYGAVRPSKKEAIEVADNLNRLQNLFVYIASYKEDKENRLGYVFYRDYGNEAYA